MSLRRFNVIAYRVAKEFVTRLRGTPLIRVVPKQALRIVQKTGVAKAPFLSRNVFMRTLQRILQNNGRLFARPFAAIGHNYHARMRNDHIRQFSFIKLHGRGDANRFDRIRNLFGQNARYNNSLNSSYMPDNLSGYEIGEHIACGCNAAVYELKKDNTMNDLNQKKMEKPFDGYDSLKKYPLALKIMFNYNYDMPERFLWREMGPEIIPLIKIPKVALQGKMGNFKPLKKSHPNLIKMHTAFIDVMPLLRDAEELYPEALPNVNDLELLNREPKTMFIVMQRYRMTLRDYVITRKRNYWKGRVMFGQLLEAIVYLQEHKISHRDIKSDNVLLDFDLDDDVPHLVLSDFGSALASGDWLVKFEDEYVDLGGNLCLRAPEIRRARPGPNVVLDFSMADLWGCGTLGYEIFTRMNPFYSRISSETYEEHDIASLPKRIPNSVKNITYDMLKINPHERCTPAVAANVISISLFRFGQDIRTFLQQCGLKMGLDAENLKNSFSSTLNGLGEKLERKIDGVIELYAGETIISRLISPGIISKAELQLRATFLARLNHEEVWSAMKYFYDDETPQSKPTNGAFLKAHASLPETFSSAELN
uniref:non-specific serine/threonine protein kinase n=1 Tax=Ditylenchus dipsaci TaxID=166011 RepID=A0A915EI36_9BILA